MLCLPVRLPRLARHSAHARALSTASPAPLPVRARPPVPTHVYARQSPGGEVTARRAVPAGIARPPYAASGAPPRSYPPVTIHNAAGMTAMRAAGAAASALLSFACAAAAPGVTTDELDAAVHEHCVRALRVYPSPLNYAGFPKSLCTSLNEVACHGIPQRGAALRAGDLLSLDVSVYTRDGVHGDTCRTVIVGGRAATDEAGRALDAAARGALDAALAICGPGVPIAAVGALIEPRLAAAGYAPVREYAGHGIGAAFHTRPIVMHHRNAATEVMRPGMTFTIEPIVVEGAPAIDMWPDGWTVVTADGRRAAQYEHTLLITEHGVEVLTAYEE